MATTTNLSTLKINYLTQAQFDALETKEANEIYLTPDASITGVTAGTGLSGGGTSGGITLSLATVSRTNNTSTASPAHSGTFTAIDSITTDSYGRVTAVNTKTVTLPSDNNTHNTAYLYAGASNGTANAATTNGNTYLILMDGGSATTRRKISGSTNVSVASDSSGNITITGPDLSGYLTSHRTYTSFTGKPTANATPAFGGTVTISQISQSTTGQVSGTDRTITIPSTIATYNGVGLVKPAYSSTNAATLTTTAATNTTTPTIAAKTTTSGRYYAVEIDKNGVLFVNVPWENTSTDTNTWRKVQLDGTDKLGTAITTNPLNFKAGTNVSITESSGTFTFSATDTNDDTKNTAGSTDTSSKIFLIGATSQAANPQTYSHDTAYVGTDGCLYSGGSKVLTAHQDISGKIDTAGTGLSKSGTTLNHSNSVTAQTTQAIYPIKIDAQGHISAYGSAVTPLTSHQTIKQDGITGATANRFGTCSTAAATAAKTVSITTGTFALEAGSMVTVKFSNANTANSPTLNVNSSGAKNIFHRNAQITTGANKALLSGVVLFVYDGTQWHLIDGHYVSSGTTSITPVTSKTVVTGGSTTSITPVTKKTVVTSVTKKTVVTGGDTTSITPVTSKTVVTSASGATATYSAGKLTLTNGSFGTGASVTSGTAINAYTSLTTGDSVTVSTGDSVTEGTAINAYTSLTTGASVTSGTAVTVVNSVTTG